MPSSADPVAHALESAAVALTAAIGACSDASPVVLIDGRSGAGKTTLARMLAARWPRSGAVEVVALDSLYPGWDGLSEGAEYARETILVPHAQGRIARWRRWDWAADERAEEHEIPASTALIVEGAGLLTAPTAPLGDIRVWLESPAPSRRTRALDRDGDGYRPHWDRWAAQEEHHLAHDRPRELATHVWDIP